MNNKELQYIINSIYESWEGNNFKTLGEPDQPIWEKPSIGIAAGDDKYFSFLKKHIGEFYWSPLEFFNLKYGQSSAENQAKLENLRVISLVFPQTEATKKAQMKEKRFPSRNWVVSRGEWEPIIKDFSGRLIKELEALGLRAVSLDLQPEFHREDSKELGIASTWSHRHTAHAAGLGTFSLSDGLITERGMAVRLTSLIIEAPLEITERPYTEHNEWCLYYKDGSCGACIKRCPVGAISKSGHNKAICSDYEDVMKENLPADIDTSNYILGCGLCQVAVPCQGKRP